MNRNGIYLPDNLDNPSDEGGIELYESVDDLTGSDDRVKFHIGQVYDKKPATALCCAICGGNHFHIGKGSYFTAVKCVNCGWEACIHDG